MDAYMDLRERAFEANMQIPARRLALYTWGNVSAFDARKAVFAIKPSGVPYEKLDARSMVVVDLDGKVVDGDLRPSSDTPTHAVIYREFAERGGAKIGGVIHTHSTFAVAWAQSLRPVPLYGTTHADHMQTEIPCAPCLSREAVERDYEKETGNLIVSHFKKLSLNPDEATMTLVGGHGPFAWGKDADAAVYNGAVLEEICKMAFLTESLNPNAKPLPAYIVEKHYQRKHGSRAYYGQKN